jgi:hypothetical protein
MFTFQSFDDVARYLPFLDQLISRDDISALDTGVG